MVTGRRAKVAGLLIVVVIVLSVFAPVVGYSKSFNIWYAYKNGLSACNSSSLNFSESQACMARYKYPPAQVNGYASIAYALFGVGYPPFSSQVVVTQGNYSVLAYFRGSQLTALEGLGFAGLSVNVNPSNVVSIRNTTFVRTGFGQLNVTVTVQNVGKYPIVADPNQFLLTGPSISIQIPGSGLNQTDNDGVTWVGGNLLGMCAPVWQPGSLCVTSASMIDTLPTNKSFSYYVEVRGKANGASFFYRQGFQGGPLPTGVDGAWVQQFVGLVNQARGSNTLVENSTLDQFARLRFTTAATQPDISDFGLATDAGNFFGGSPPVLMELLLYPESNNPISYESYLQAYGPGHWGALVNSSFSQYGYYIGEAPYETVIQPCPVSEIPSGGLNITQYFQQFGCSVRVQQTTWLVIILSK